ncbi:MAG TPA: hypothetical protein VIZ65_05050 [Cellvibrionaceae bacterium]
MANDKKLQDNFDRVLTQQLRNATPYIADAGFSEAVMQRLPQLNKASNFGVGLSVVGGLLAAVICIYALPALVAPVVFWANSLNLVGLIHLGLWSLVSILGAVVAWLSRQLDWF